MKKTKGQLQLESAGFTVNVAHGGRWFEVTRNGENAIILRQHENCWHWFGQDIEATASGCNPAQCDSGGLGDAIDTDGELRTYKRLMIGAPGKLTRKYAGLYRASSDAYNE